MRENKSFTRKAGDFLAGKGFYIVLFVCTAVIGVSAWALLFTDKPAGTDGSYLDTASYPVTTAKPFPSPSPSGLPAFSQGAPSPAQSPKPTPTIVPVPPTQKPAPSPAPKPSSTPPPASPPENTAQDSGGEHASGPAKLTDVTFLWPLSGEVALAFSVDELVFSRTMGDWRTHAGIDIKGALGAKVTAAADGKVADILRDDMLGTVVVVDHGFGMLSYSANLASSPTVKVGDTVSAGSVIGAIGSTALGETGDVSHLHFELRLNGAPVDPAAYLR